MTVNEDTYVLPQESDELLSEVLPAFNPLRITWAALEEKDKAGFLQAAVRRMEGLNVVGQKVNFWQKLKFPRIARGVPPDFEQAPREVKRAQVVWATEIVREELYVKKRNVGACIALGIISEATATCSVHDTPPLVKELMHKWITQWRRL